MIQEVKTVFYRKFCWLYSFPISLERDTNTDIKFYSDCASITGANEYAIKSSNLQVKNLQQQLSNLCFLFIKKYIKKPPFLLYFLYMGYSVM